MDPRPKLPGLSVFDDVGAFVRETDRIRFTGDAATTIDPQTGQVVVEVTGGGGGAHPDLATHDALGLATDAELTAHATAGNPHSVYVLASVVDAKGDLLIGTADNVVGRRAVGANGEFLTANSGTASGLAWSPDPVLAHAAAGDPHTGYVLESAHGTTSPAGHHAQVHAINGGDHTGTLAHSALGSIGADDHHAQAHVLTSVNHTAAGLTVGQTIRASGATSFEWNTLQHGDLGGVSADQHHARDHSIIGSEHTGFPGGTTNFLRADGTFAAPPGGGVTDHGALTGLSDNDHPQYGLLASANVWTEANTGERTSGQGGWGIRQAGDAVTRWAVRGSGLHAFSDGTNAADLLFGRTGSEVIGIQQAGSAAHPSWEMGERTSSPATPSSGFWRQFFKPGGLFIVEDDGTISPLGRRRVKSADQSFNTGGSLTDCTGLAAPMEAGKTYGFRAMLIMSSNATTNGWRAAINGPASPTQVAYLLRIPTSTTAESLLHANAYDTTIATTTSPGTTFGVVVIEGVIENGANAGDLTVRFGPESSNNANVHQGSTFDVWELP